MMLKLKWLLLGLFLMPALLRAQEAPFFSENSEVFITQVAEQLQLSGSKRNTESGKQLMQSLTNQWNAGRFNKEEKDRIKAIAEKMHTDKIRIYPDFYAYFFAIDQFASSLQLPSSIIAWNDYAMNLLAQGNSKGFSDLMKFTGEFMQSGKLFDRNTVQWYAHEVKFGFVYDSLLGMQFDKANLLCSTVKDTSIIEKTKGYYSYERSLWTGQGGVVTWRRFNLDPKSVYAELSRYSVDLNQSEYAADSVVFRNLNYYKSPMIGSLQDKVFSSPPNPRTAYPRFVSYVKNFVVPNVFPNIDFEGGLTMEGMSLIGSGDGQQRASLTFKRDGKIFGRMLSNAIQIGDERLFADRVAATFYLEGDSLYHPGLRMRYTNNNRQLILFRSETGVADSPFFNSFHMIDLYVEAMYWDIDKMEIAFRRLEGIGNESNGRFESANYYADIEFRRLQGIDDVNPMFMIENYLKTYGDGREIKLNALAGFMKKPSEQIVAQLLRLAAKGFLVYDPATETAVVKDRFFYTLAARGARTDYDVIKLNSTTTSRTPNALLNLGSLELIINGVNEVILSDSQSVNIFPDKGMLVMKKNRDFVFSGLIKAGLFNFYARDCFFQYDSFKLNMNYVDSLAFYARVRKSDRKVIQAEYVKVRNVIADLNGTLYIDDPHNKSGLRNFPRYPLFNSKSESYVYYDKAAIQSGALDRKRFYYAVDPFEIDSLDNFKTDNMKFEGYLASAGIFPGFREPLGVMADYSLGFLHDVPETGYGIFDNKGKYYKQIHLSNQGFFGAGSIDYLTTSSSSDKYIFYPDSITASALQLKMAEKLTPTEYPRAQTDTVSMVWQANPDKMMLTSNQKPIIMYNNAEFHGELDISPSGSGGSGHFDFGDAEVISGYFDFRSRDFAADTANFTLYTSVEKKQAFSAVSYKTAINFDKRLGMFTYLDENSQLSFPFNQYICSLDEAKWQMDEDRLYLNNNRINKVFDIANLNHNQLLDIDLSGSGFISTHPEQDSLSFFCLEAEYDLVNYAINARNVKIIRVADAAIFPNDGLITIQRDARMQSLESATIIANTTTRYHLINDARVTIFSKHKFEGRGYYDYIDNHKTVQPIELSAIWVDEQGVTNAQGSIPESAIFFLNPYFYFSGQTKIKADRKQLQFAGGYRINQECYDKSMAWVAFDTLVDPADVRLPVSADPNDLSGIKLNAGLFYSASSGKYYASLLDYRRSIDDKPLMGITGSLYFDEKRNAFVVQPHVKTTANTLFSLNNDRCMFTGNGKLDLDLQMPFVSMESYGSFNHKIIADSTYLNVFVVLRFMFDEKIMTQMSDSLAKANLTGLNLTQGNYLYAMGQKMPKADLDKLTNDISLYGAPRKVPEQVNDAFVLSDVKLRWNNEFHSFVSTGPIGIANVLRGHVNKYVEGFVEFEKSRAGDGFSMYFQLDANTWYYFNYRNGILQAVSSSEQFNNDLMNLKPEKRTQQNRSTGEQYEFVISTRQKAVDFIRRMQSVQ